MPKRGDIMSKLIITAGSVTTAVRIKKKLHSAGDIRASVIHTPAFINSGGCSYSVKTDYSSLGLVRQLAKENKIKYRKLFAESNTNGGKEYYDIS